MKKLTLVLAVAMMAIATTASAQFVNGGTRSSMVADTENYSRLELGYSPVTIEKFDLTGLSLGWTKGISLTQDLPLFLEVGANVMYSFGEKHDIEISLLSLNVPVTIAWKFAPTESISIIPHAGLNLRGHILGTEESFDDEDYDLFDSDEGDGKRFNVGGTVGLAANFNKFMVGLGYTFDFNETWKKTDKLNYLTISIGLKF